ncbi:MAG: A/G-specific adenine glycosylase, partial [Nannocystaceae bacterium]
MIALDAAAFSRRLTRWFNAGHREMPWRATRDPYAIWVSEIMLQQTRVDTVRAYYSEFLRRFPSVEALAEATEDAVLGAWSGLGYYRRARLLHAGAQDVMARFGGVLPADLAALRSIPGIGPYTAGAIAAIAFDLPAPVVDGNVARVLSRVRAVRQERAQAATARHHWETAEEVISKGSPRILAQAMMELGATVCVPVKPACGECPVRPICEAFRRDLV